MPGRRTLENQAERRRMERRLSERRLTERPLIRTVVREGRHPPSRAAIFAHLSRLVRLLLYSYVTSDFQVTACRYFASTAIRMLKNGNQLRTNKRIVMELWLFHAESCVGGFRVYVIIATHGYSPKGVTSALLVFGRNRKSDGVGLVGEGGTNFCLNRAYSFEDLTECVSDSRQRQVVFLLLERQIHRRYGATDIAESTNGNDNGQTTSLVEPIIVVEERPSGGNHVLEVAGGTAS
ncbi:hypothetical protein EVAR_78873_1 [Eumeta japonica]|uniref:Uncharacterized protein n=1 Tax=Eumeta variegata TaxID=151549 RepID=A0A4C1U3U3_EUMVA|nr:hypothetical protein EVAR_78873_1 [Eumeta japonica]